MSNFYRFYGDAPRLLSSDFKTVEKWIKAEREQKEFIGQKLTKKEKRNLRDLWKSDHRRDKE